MSNNKKLTVTFLGTGTSTGVPIIGSDHPVAFSKDPRDKRLRSSIMISWDTSTYIIDSGPDFRQQMIREDVQNINGILYTHEHADHIAGFDDIRAFCFKMGDVPIYCCQRVLECLQNRYAYIFETENRYPNAPSVAPTIISHKNSFILEGVKVTPVQVMHGKLPILGFRFNNFAYITDIKSITDDEKEKLFNLDVLILTGLKKESHPTHFNLADSLALIEELNPKKTYLTHISEQLGFHEEVSKELPKNVYLAFDGLKVEV